MVKWFNRGKNRPFHAQQGGYNVTPALAEYGIAKKFMEEGKEVKRGVKREATEEVIKGYDLPIDADTPRKLTALDVIKCVLSVALFLLVCYYGGVQYGK
jgi:hypothetical protein